MPRARQSAADAPTWTAGSRFIAPAESRWHGYIVDLSAQPYAIVYRVVDGGAAVEVPAVYPVMF